MRELALRRLVQLPIILVAVLLLVFMFLMTTGDLVEIWAPPMATEADKAQLRKAYGLDRPLPEQFLAFLSRAVRGDFGTSFFRGEAAWALVLRRLPLSIALALAATALGSVVGIQLGIAAARRRGTLLDQLVSLLALMGQSAPGFWLALMLMLVFSVWLRWLPVSGGESLAHMVLPVVALSFWLIALLSRLTRSGMLEVLGQDYIRTAYAKGLSLREVFHRHALKNALLPLVTVMGLSVGWLLGGAIVVETVFALPGLGTLLLDAVLQRDYPVVLAGVTVLAMTFIGVNLVVDLLYGYLNPKIRYRAEER
jgi:ABC-type dipeptide/oligopeptide/nickel transport system permease component